jgi:hypothetical protein
VDRNAELDLLLPGGNLNTEKDIIPVDNVSDREADAGGWTPECRKEAMVLN